MKHIHILHYLVLGALLTGGVATFFFVRSNVTLQLYTGIATSVAYVLWGIIHHALQKDLHPKIVIEYTLIGAIAIVLLVTILDF
ncbi:hypothetical protein A2363_03075 [Candidatus Gottesmanbacteria bacterium RIFOXYB1_FULL_47_11]|uniref:Uncharacterized protein n=1 Tax=Candidatus Gottesmanbacteria bacterium RIFOXYB1_FULL_47_11 TaxID=1798401 RepID=A0A1F6BFK6_9BACT|nr:MAG: hypothetical protein A2363_03075 [Candidatus Gottesmanbacteria bacterium RIFOXYB1_FULL_47_11]